MRSKCVLIGFLYLTILVMFNSTVGEPGVGSRLVK
jgi:hypothetical protein